MSGGGFLLSYAPAFNRYRGIYSA